MHDAQLTFEQDGQSTAFDTVPKQIKHLKKSSIEGLTMSINANETVRLEGHPVYIPKMPKRMT